MKGLIREAIDASIKFEALMDSIDFNSYLEPEEDEKIKRSSGYQLYEEKTKEALNLLKIFSNEYYLKLESVIPDPEKELEFTKWLISELFNAKELRLKARKKLRKNERIDYTSITCKLYIAFDKIPEKDFTKKIKNLLDSRNWAKVLYYNELAICYSGLAKSSMSLGYAEQSIRLLEKLYPDIKNIENEPKKWEKNQRRVEKEESPLNFSQIIKLYTFALYNRGEAQHLLRYEELALKTFQRVIEIYKKKEGKTSNPETSGNSDYIAASIRKGMILADMGRGHEAQKVFDEINNNDKTDYRFWEAQWEKSIAFIDGKDYTAAYDNLERIKKKQEQCTFINRKTRICSVLLLNEFKKNRQKDYDDFKKNTQKNYDNNTSLAKKIEEQSKAIINSPNIILKETIERQDGGNYKRVCTYLAKYFKTLEKNEDQIEEGQLVSLKYLYLYLFYKKFFEDQEMCSLSENSGFIDEWTENNNNDIWRLLGKYRKKCNRYFLDVLDQVEEENYLEDFFNLYVTIVEKEKDKGPCNKEDRKIVTKLKERLGNIYSQKENMICLEKIDDLYNHFDGICSKSTNAPQKDNATRFIEEYFFTKKNLATEGFLLHDSIVQKMRRNTNNFISKVVGNSKFPGLKEEKIIGRLNILRRWNSFTPALRSPVNQSKGGGYFLYIASEGRTLGIVIDPGYNFLENFFSQGFRIGDIDIVLVSHAHPDHTDNLPSILSLLHEMNDRLGDFQNKKKRNKKVFTLVLSPGVFEHYSHIIKPSEEHLKDIVVTDIKEGSDIETVYSDTFNGNYQVKIEAFGTSHKDLSSSKSQSLGFKITVEDNTNQAKSIIGYTSDAKWKFDSQNWAKHFIDCTIICAHLGSIVNVLEDKDFCKAFCETESICSNDENFRKGCKKSGFNKVNVVINKLKKQTQEENHLYLGGLASFFNRILADKESNLKLAVISEFGEELKEGIRIDLSRKLDSWFSEDFDQSSMEKPRCLPGDIGLEIDIFTGNVFCHCCERFVERDQINPIPYGREEAIFFVCKECESVLSSYQIGEKLKDYHENGRKLELAHES